MKAKKPKPKKKPSTSAPKPIPQSDLCEFVGSLDEMPSDFWDTVEGTWDWANLRKGGKLTERIQQLDQQFVARSKTHRVCPIVLLLNSGEKE